MNQPPSFLNPLLRPQYVIRMNWWRWTKKHTKIKWLLLMREACTGTIRNINEELERIKDDD